MKTKKITKKLVLNKTTVSNLNKLEQSNVRGGDGISTCETCDTCETYCGTCQTECLPCQTFPIRTCQPTFGYENSCVMGICGP